MPEKSNRDRLYTFSQPEAQERKGKKKKKHTRNPTSDTQKSIEANGDATKKKKEADTKEKGEEEEKSPFQD